MHLELTVSVHGGMRAVHGSSTAWSSVHGGHTAIGWSHATHHGRLGTKRRCATPRGRHPSSVLTSVGVCVCVCGVGGRGGGGDEGRESEN